MTEEIRSLFDTTITAYQENDHQAGMEACERLLSLPGLPPELESYTRQNQTWYLKPIALTGSEEFRSGPPYTLSKQVTLPARPIGWSLFNPSIGSDERGDLKMIVRASNYHIEPSGRYNVHDPDGVIRTTNYLVDFYPGTLRVSSVDMIDTSAVDASRRDYLVQGFEDARLFYANSAWQFLATVRDRHPDGRCQIARCSLSHNRVTTMDIIERSPFPGRNEKNWMPISQEQSYVYQVGVPFMRYERYGHGRWAWAPSITRTFRGGAICRIGQGNWLLAIVHEAIDFPEGYAVRRVYQHRFVSIINGNDVVKISPPFCFESRGIEFAAGMVRMGDDLVISYGVNDARAMLLTIPLEQAISMVRDPYPEAL